MGLARDFRIDERRRIEFRWEVFNIFNHPNFGLPDNDINLGTFGQVFSTATPERQMQFALKFISRGNCVEWLCFVVRGIRKCGLLLCSASGRAGKPLPSE